MVRHTLKIHLLQYLKVPSHFGILCIKTLTLVVNIGFEVFVHVIVSIFPSRKTVLTFIAQ